MEVRIGPEPSRASIDVNVHLSGFMTKSRHSELDRSRCSENSFFEELFHGHQTPGERVNSGMLMWHLYDGNPRNALTRQLHQMLMVRENDGLPVATDFCAKVQCGRRTRVIKGLHNIIKDHGKGAWIAGETAIPRKP